VRRRRTATGIAIAVGVAALVWVLFVGLPRWYSEPADAGQAAPAASGPEEPVRKIQAQLFFVSEDGRGLTSVEQEVAFAEDPSEQARVIVSAQITPAVPPLVSAIPPGTALRALFLTPGGEAYVDFSPELASAHAGGSTHELLTIYTIVNALTVNLPMIRSVQLLVEGREVDTLAGHIDLRQPAAQSPDLVQ
jgi:spore germination protein GerM